MIVSFSPESDPYLNLAMEGLIAQSLREDVLFLWVDRPSVVIGRNQLPWAECHTSRLGNVFLVRRFSGGGAVYHDKGNLNFSFVQGPQAAVSRNLEIVRKAMMGLGAARVVCDRRHRLLMNGRKISGSAFRMTSRFRIHHGTILVDSDLDRMKELLVPSVEVVWSRAVRSEPYPVCNLAEFLGITDPWMVAEALVKSVAENMPVDEVAPCELVDQCEARQEASFLRSWRCVYGKSPDALVRLPGTGGVSLLVKISGGMTRAVMWEANGVRGGEVWAGCRRFHPSAVWDLVVRHGVARPPAGRKGDGGIESA